MRDRTTVDYSKVHEIRRIVEVAVAGLAAERATPEDIGHLSETCEALRHADTVEEMTHADVEFHRGLCLATHNDLFLVMLDAVGDPLGAVRLLTFDRPGRLHSAINAHDQILARVRAGDVLGARAVMTHHLDDVQRMWASYSASVIASKDADQQEPKVT